MLSVAVCLLSPNGLAAQELPSGPLTIGDRVVVAADVSASIAPVDRGYFHVTDYEHSMVRLFTLGVSGVFRVNERVSLLGELRTDNGDGVRASALYIRLRPWPTRGFDIQAGRVPPVFGTIASRLYVGANPLIGYPLAYQYLTTVRSGALPGNADELLEVRGQGWLTAYGPGAYRMAGADYYDHGLPLISAFRWDTGVQVRWMAGPFEVLGAVTAGAPGESRIRENNNGKQLAGRLVWRPVPAWTFGASVARGAFLDDRVLDALPAPARNRRGVQRALGTDVEFAAGHWQWRGEIVLSDWSLPSVPGSGLDGRLGAASFSTEARWRIAPRVYLAGRAEHLAFSRIHGTWRGTDEWDAPTSRFELGTGYSLQRNLVAKFSVLHDRRDAGWVRQQTAVAAQLAYWF